MAENDHTNTVLGDKINIDDILIASNVYLWCYSLKSGLLDCFDNVSVYTSKFSNGSVSHAYAIKDGLIISRFVDKREYGVWCHPNNKKYVIWSKAGNRSQIENRLTKVITYKARNSLIQAVDSIKEQHDILDTLACSFHTNCVVSHKTYEDLVEDINEYFYSVSTPLRG